MPSLLKSKRETSVAVLVITCWVSSLSPLAASDTLRDHFENMIRPVLVESCYECHSAKSKRLGGNLRLDTRESILQGGDLGPAVVLGNPEKSLLVRALEHADEDLKMPKHEAQLTPATIESFRQWIQNGLYWPETESLPITDESKKRGFDLAHRKARLPWIWNQPKAQAIPTVADANWPQNEIDHFILAKLEDEGLKPNRSADPAIWLRRVSLTLTGLPPSQKLLEQFIETPSARRHRFAVDSLLASPRFGERWARHWMDLVRYAESRGHESDYVIANAYHYRDYLIRAFNDDLPYDQFIVEQLAGDLLPHPRKSHENEGNESVLGTAWPFLGEEVHSPVDIRQDECDRIDNKVDVLSKTFLGLTVACARCHDHKFDAISQQDYYGLAGFFLSSNFQQVRFESQLSNQAVSRRLEQVRKEFQPLLWQSLVESFPPNIDVNVSAASKLRQARQVDAKGIVRIAREGIQGARIVGQGMRMLSKGTWYSPMGDPNILEISSHDAVRRDPNWKGLRIRNGNQQDAGSLDATSRSSGMLKTQRFKIESGKLRYLIRGKTKIYAAVDNHIMVTGPLHGTLVKVFESKDSKTPEWVTHDLSAYRGHLVHLEFGLVDDADLEILKVIESEKTPEPYTDFKNGETKQVPQTVVAQAVSEFMQEGYQFDRLSPDNQMIMVSMARKVLKERIQKNNPFDQVSSRFVSSKNAAMKEAQFESLTAVALSDNNGVDESILIRGNAKRPGKPAPRRLLSAFGYSPQISSQGSGRLQLAESIASARNPLASRVIVNRVWHHLFGRGIVPTVDNFGYLGEPPSHPELLDHLAFEFTETDQWSLKQLIRKIVLSQTYRMSSQLHVETEPDRDPNNILLSRFPVRRLEAEAIRDNMLAVCGDLNTAMFGKSVPVHLTDFVIGRGRPGESGPLDGNGRRSVYIATRRNFLPTLMTAFDYPTPFSTIGKRNVTNVPAQSLALSNDEFVHSQALAWATSLLQAPDPGIEKRIETAFRTAFSRSPSQTEQELCIKALAQFLSINQGSQTELNSWRDLCHSLLVMNEFFYIR
ncbi:PSD1 and planctomycete cytochrome C domain-containing protein [Verrucomicrobia bacterium]|nr:PSD1 and planctomycete cytochrome C domain-containing protein [Verrucomicrobiota bacterium]MDA7866533.1 PSD1 and planctomycete cytochrome C domain-containing protein [Verrucomicrobiota bacterium]